MQFDNETSSFGNNHDREGYLPSSGTMPSENEKGLHSMAVISRLRSRTNALRWFAPQLCIEDAMRPGQLWF